MKSYSDGRIGTVVENRPAVGSSDDKVRQRDSRARIHAKEKKKKSFQVTSLMVQGNPSTSSAPPSQMELSPGNGKKLQRAKKRRTENPWCETSLSAFPFNNNNNNNTHGEAE